VTVTVTVDVVIRLPASETFTQKVPGFSVADSCGFPAAIAPDVELAIVQLPLLDGPTPSPSGLVVAGDTDVEPFGARVPLKVSVIGVSVEGVVGLPNRLLSGLEQADVIITDAGIRRDRNSRWTVMLALIGVGPRAD